MTERIAYLNTEYPAVSHTFIVREVQALRRSGVDIVTFSVRRPRPSESLNREYAAELAATRYLLGNPMALILSHCRALLSPLAYLSTFLAAQRLSPGGWRARVRWAAYFAQGIHLAAQLRRSGIPHIHVHMANNGAAVARFATMFDRALSYSLSIHGSAEFFDVHNLRLGWKTEGARFVRCISEFCRAQIMIWSAPEAWDRFHVVHCGIDPTEFSPAPPRATDGVLRLVTVGRLVPIKGYPTLLLACRELSLAGVAWRLTMVGDGPMRSSLERLATELGIQDRITFRGALAGQQVRDELDRADALIISSFMEGVPVVLMEAMAKGLAVVSTRVGGVPELIDDGRNGVLVTPGCVESLCQALQRVARHDLPPEAPRQARERITADYSVQGVRDGMLKLFRRYGIVAANAPSTAIPRDVAEREVASAL